MIVDKVRKSLDGLGLPHHAVFLFMNRGRTEIHVNYLDEACPYKLSTSALGLMFSFILLPRTLFFCDVSPAS